MPAAVRIYENGGPEVLRLEQVDPGKPATGEVQIRHTAIGVNYIDVYDRTGLYPVKLPSGLGREAAGVVTALGRGVRGLRVGERVAYVFPSPGAYCELRNVPAERVVRVPRGISDEQAAALMIDPDAGVYPMVGPGQSYDEMITGEFIPSRHKVDIKAPGPSEMF